MRLGWIVSAIGHVGLVLATLFAWPSQSMETPREGMVVPVEVVNIGDINNVMALAPEPDPEDEADTPNPEDEPVATEEPVPEAAPSPTPRPQERRNSNELDLAALNRELLMDKQRPSGERRNPRVENAQRADRAREGAGLGTQEVVTLQARFAALMRAHFARNQCWRASADATDPDRLQVTVAITLNRNGSLMGEPQLVRPTSTGGDPEMRAAIDNALRAVRQCEPFPLADDPVAAEHYNLWRRTEYTFGTRRP